MVKIMVGNEPYMVDCMARRESKLNFPDFNLLKSSAFGEEEDLFLSSYPMMDDKRVLVLSLKKLDDLKGEYFEKWADETDTQNVIVVKVSEYDARTSFYKECVKKNLIVPCSKKDLYNSIIPILQKRVAAKGAVMDNSVIESMIKRTGYLENDEINMYSLVGYLNTMLSLEKNITLDLMESIVPSFYKEDAFCLAKLICSKDMKGLRKQAELLKGTEIETLSALLREFRISYKAKYFPLKEIGVSYSAFLKKDKEYLAYGIRIISDTVAGIKNGTIIVKDCLMDVFLQLLNWKGGVV